MRLLLVVNFFVSVAALIVAVMALGRVNTALDKGEAALEKTSGFEAVVDGKLASVQERARQAVDAAVGSVNAKFRTSLDSLKAQVRKLENELTDLPTTKEVEVIAAKKASIEVDKKVAALQKQVAELAKSFARQTVPADLAKRVADLERQFAKWVEIILPPEAVGEKAAP